MAVLKISGDIIGNDDKWIYDFFGFESTAPSDVEAAIKDLKPGEKLEVLINSCGGSVLAGQEIYSELRRRHDVEIEIQSIAGSAASVIAMAGHSKISPVATIMIHNVSISGASGDCNEMEKQAEVLRQMNEALANAYVEKTGMEMEKVLELMNEETWLTAKQCVELGFVDEVAKYETQFVNASMGLRLTDELRKQAIAERDARASNDKKRMELLEDLDMYGV